MNHKSEACYPVIMLLPSWLINSFLFLMQGSFCLKTESSLLEATPQHSYHALFWSGIPSFEDTLKSNDWIHEICFSKNRFKKAVYGHSSFNTSFIVSVCISVPRGFLRSLLQSSRQASPVTTTFLIFYNSLTKAPCHHGDSHAKD